MVNVTFLLKGEDRRFKHLTCKLLRNLSLTELFVVRNKIISTNGKQNEVFRDMVERWIAYIRLEVHHNPPIIKYFKMG